MNWVLLIKKIILAFIQGISEILPISSSGHLLIASELLQIDTNGLALIIYLHFGSLIAVIIYYRQEIKNILFSLFKYIFQKDRQECTLYYAKLFCQLIVATIPAVIVGLLFNDVIDQYLSNLYFVFTFIFLTGILLLVEKEFKYSKTLKTMSFVDALLIGCFQGLGVLPGLSRSGITIFGHRTRKINHHDAAYFSFLMFIPISLGSFVYQVFDEYETLINLKLQDFAIDLTAVILSSFITYFSLKYFFKIIKKGKLHYFAYYCICLSLIGLLFCLFTNYGF